jgi:hypothetical protein
VSSPLPGGQDVCIYVPRWHGRPVILPGAGFPSCHLPRARVVSLTCHHTAIWSLILVIFTNQVYRSCFSCDFTIRVPNKGLFFFGGGGGKLWFLFNIPIGPIWGSSFPSVMDLKWPHFPCSMPVSASSLHSLWPWRWRQHVQPKCCYSSTVLHSVRTEKTIVWMQAEVINYL